MLEKILLDRTEASLLMNLPKPAVDALISKGMLTELDIEGTLRIPYISIQRLVEGMLNNDRVPQNTEITPRNDIPTLAEIRQMVPRKVAPITYKGRNGMQVEWKYPGYEYDFEVQSKRLTLLVYVPDNPSSGTKDLTKAVVFRNGLRHGPQAVVEFTRTSDYANTGLLASVVKINGRVVRIDEQPPVGYDQLTLGIYNQVVNIDYAKVGRCVLAAKDDIAAMAFHGLLRCRQRKDI